MISSLVMRLSPEIGQGVERGRRTDHPETDARSGKQGSNRRPEGRHRQCVQDSLIAIAIVGMEERGVLLRRPQKSAGRRARAR